MNLTELSLNFLLNEWNRSKFKLFLVTLDGQQPTNPLPCPGAKIPQILELSQRVINSSVGDSKSKIRASMGFGGRGMVRVTQDRAGKSKFRGVTLCGRGATSGVSSVRNLRLLCEFVSGSKSWYVGQMEGRK